MKLAVLFLTFYMIFQPQQALAKFAPGAYQHYQKQAQEKQRIADQQRFTPQETQFLKRIANKAVQFIDTNYTNAKKQNDCVASYIKDPTSCPFGAEIIKLIKQRYLEYRQTFALGNLKKFNQHRSLPGAPPSNIVSSSYSRYPFDYSFPESDKINEQAERDSRALRSRVTQCDMTEADVNMFYNTRVIQIISSTPVVLLIKVIPDDLFSMFKPKKYLPDNIDIANAFGEYLNILTETRKTFAGTLTADQLEGLFMYQMLAAQAISDNPATWLPVYESLSKKLLPQNQLQSFAYWAKNTFFSLNTLFLGCAVGGSVIVATTGFVPAGVAAAACTSAAAVLAGYTLITDMMEAYEVEQEWMSGVRERDAVETMRSKVLIDMVLLAFNLYALKAVTPANMGFTTTAPDAVEVMATATGDYSKKIMESTVKDFVKEQGIDVVRGELVALGFGSMFRQAIKAKELDRLSQVSAEILYQYQQTGTYTFSSQADILCKMKRDLAGGQ